MTADVEGTTRLQACLGPEERLLWTGRPDRGLGRAEAVLLARFVCGLVITDALLAWEMLRESGPLIGTVVGALYVATGIYFLGLVFYGRRRRRTRTTYGLTNLRALVLEPAAAIDEAPLPAQPARLTRSRDGRHVSVVFGPGTRVPSRGTRGTRLPLAFYSIADPEELLAALRRAGVQA